MTYKSKAALFAAISALTLLGGCGMDDTSEPRGVQFSLNAQQETQEPQTEPQTEPMTEEPTEDDTLPPFKVENIINSMTLCGNQLSYPLTYGGLGEGFYANTDIFYKPYEDEDFVGYSLYYKGSHFGNITLRGVKDVKNIPDDVLVVGISINDFDVEGYSVEPVTIYGMGFGSRLDDLMAAIGAECTVSGNHSKHLKYLEEDNVSKLDLFGDDTTLRGIMILQNATAIMEQREQE